MLGGGVAPLCFAIPLPFFLLIFFQNHGKAGKIQQRWKICRRNIFFLNLVTQFVVGSD